MQTRFITVTLPCFPSSLANLAGRYEFSREACLTTFFLGASFLGLYNFQNPRRTIPLCGPTAKRQ